MKLYLIHCGYYDAEVGGGLFESHINYFVCADSFESARINAKLIPEFAAKRMHIDGLQEIQAVGGFDILLKENQSLKGSSQIINFKHRDLAPKPPST